VIVFCNKDLTKELIETGCEIIEVNENINHQILREMHEKAGNKKFFRIAVAEDQFGMRGFDYRA